MGGQRVGQLDLLVRALDAMIGSFAIDGGVHYQLRTYVHTSNAYFVSAYGTGLELCAIR